MKYVSAWDVTDVHCGLRALPGALRRLQYSSYQAYLRSPLWAGIRSAVLARYCGKCLVCGEEATEVHHLRYDEETLSGDLSGLTPICRACHKRIHFTSAGKRRSLGEANWVMVRRYDRLRELGTDRLPEMTVEMSYSEAWIDDAVEELHLLGLVHEKSS